MVRTRTSEDPIIDIPKGSVGCGCGQVSCGNAPPPPSRPSVSLEQLLLAQNDLMHLLMENETCHGADCQQPQYQDQDSMYSFPGDSVASLCRGDESPGGGQLSIHDGVQV
jgi:hypothetical protein